MEILPCSSISLDCLKNALLINEHGAEFRIKSFSFDLKTTEILVDFQSSESLPFNSLSNFSIQLQNHV